MKFVSFVIPWFNRSYYIGSVLNSIHDNAKGLPFEIIIHDDNSADDSTNILFNCKETISILISHSGGQVGLGKAANRAINLASSEYIIFLNSDCVINPPFNLDSICNILDKPYIGYINLSERHGASFKEFIRSSHYKYYLLPGVGLGDALAFKKSTWLQCGGFDETVPNSCADTTLLYKCWRKGLFRASLIGERQGSAVSNLSRDIHNTTDSTMNSGNDLSIPKLFNLNNQFFSKKNEWFKIFKTKHQTEKAGIGNGRYWDDYTTSLFPDLTISGINWLAGTHGQSKWEDMISKEEIHTWI